VASTVVGPALSAKRFIVDGRLQKLPDREKLS
jgi:hypothetical protein